MTLIHFDFNFIGYLINRFCVITKPIIICDITKLLIDSNCSLQFTHPNWYGLTYYRMLGMRYVLLFVIFRTSSSYRDNSFCFVLLYFTKNFYILLPYVPQLLFQNIYIYSFWPTCTTVVMNFESTCPLNVEFKTEVVRRSR